MATMSSRADTRYCEGCMKQAGADESAGRLVVVARHAQLALQWGERGGRVTSSGNRCGKAAVRLCNRQVVNITAPPNSTMWLDHRLCLQLRPVPPRVPCLLHFAPLQSAVATHLRLGAHGPMKARAVS